MSFSPFATGHAARVPMLVFAAAAAMLPGLAAAAEPTCLTAPEFTALATYSLPSVITGTVQRCSPMLPSDAFLPTQGAGLAMRYAGAKDAAWPAAKAAFLKLTGANLGSGLMKGMSETSMQEIVDTAIAAKVTDALPAERCGTVNRLVQLLAPLPPESTAGVIALAVGLGTSSGRKIGPIKVCPA